MRSQPRGAAQLGADAESVATGLFTLGHGTRLIAGVPVTPCECSGGDEDADEKEDATFDS